MAELENKRTTPTVASLAAENNALRKRMYQIEVKLRKETAARKAINIAVDQGQLIKLADDLDRWSNEKLAVIIRDCAMTEILFMAKRTDGLVPKAVDWIYRNYDAPKDAWVSRDRLTLGSWMQLVEDEIDIWDRGATAANARVRRDKVAA